LINAPFPGFFVGLRRKPFRVEDKENRKGEKKESKRSKKKFGMNTQKSPNFGLCDKHGFTFNKYLLGTFKKITTFLNL